jgi:hypothetical protein
MPNAAVVLQVVCCESHSAPGGAAHCWSRRGCHFDSGTALFFGLPAAAHPSSSAAAGGAAAAAAIAGDTSSSSFGTASSATGAGPKHVQQQQQLLHGSSDNPLSAVLELLGEPLDLIGYGPDRTRLVFPEGSFDAQVSKYMHRWAPSAFCCW